MFAIKHWRITLTVCDGLMHKDVYDVVLPETEPVGFSYGWFYIGQSFAIEKRLIIAHKIEEIKKPATAATITDKQK
ncbi:hypothetical protein [Loigolactobacillus rennini]|uniref:Uncharacterized protein n=1 Tax=Loigolactobacillus rennini DSM 20253 TaxID=1423796 RepID=A0A0R2D4H7_9LACO|nr:hypothetical protein [Loigolactobacillus rennini]KRM98785.1 hypothetical protein FC24_GL001020 [Loigolactobacillus rennini DSM 20253]